MYVSNIYLKLKLLTTVHFIRVVKQINANKKILVLTFRSSSGCFTVIQVVPVKIVIQVLVVLDV